MHLRHPGILEPQPIAPNWGAVHGVHRVACIGVITTCLLILIGGLVTSKGAGMSVPDWPTTYGYNMFLFPYSKWIGGIFWEHSHRLLATGTGLITLLLACVALLKEYRTWVKWLAFIALLAVILQGILGGLRVTLYNNQLGIFHAILAQSFLGLLMVIAAVTGKKFLSGAWFNDPQVASLRWLVLVGMFLVYFQLGIAATMRHQHTSLAISDFPTSYGHLIPDTSKNALEKINIVRKAAQLDTVTSIQIELQFLHRIGALLLFIVMIMILASAILITPQGHWMRLWSVFLLGAILLQIILGAFVIWSNKAADVSTAHMALGALLTGFFILTTFRLFCSAHHIQNVAL